MGEFPKNKKKAWFFPFITSFEIHWLISILYWLLKEKFSV